MIKTAILTLALIITSSSFAASFIDGCYKTLEINGASVMPGPDEGRSQSQIYSINENEFYYDLESRKTLRTKIISLFTQFNGGWYTFNNPLIFEDLGTFESTTYTLSYQFTGEVFHRTSSYALEKVDFDTHIELHKYRGIVTGTILQESKAMDRRISLNVILKEVACAE